MNREEGDRVEEALAKAVAMIENHEMVAFTQAEAESLRELVQVWSQLKAVVVIGSAVGNTVKWAVGFAIAWAAFKGGLGEWIKSIVK